MAVTHRHLTPPARMAEFTGAELRLIRKRIPALHDEANAELRRRVVAADPGWPYFQFTVQFDPEGVKYHFAAVRLPNGAIYTTATGLAGHFPDWESLVHWLQAADKHYVSSIRKLVHAHGVTVDPL